MIYVLAAVAVVCAAVLAGLRMFFAHELQMSRKADISEVRDSLDVGLANLGGRIVHLERASAKLEERVTQVTNRVRV